MFQHIGGSTEVWWGWRPVAVNGSKRRF